MKKLIMLMFTLTLLLGVNSVGNSVSGKTDFWESYQTQLQLREWNLFLKALIQVESGGNSMAIGKNNDGGILQITPIYVEEVNRLSKKNYTLDDRFSVEKSLEMFAIVQSHYNPNKDINKAIKLHNPGAGKDYANKIYKAIKELKNYES